MTGLVLLCTIAGCRAALPAAAIRTVIEIDRITPVPGVAPAVLGITALRSQALTVIDCNIALGCEPQADPLGSRAAVVDVDGHPYALILESASDVVEPLGDPAHIAGGFGEEWNAVALGMVETAVGPALLLDIDGLVSGICAKAA